MLPGYRWTKMRWIDFTLYKRFIVFALFGFLFTLPKRDFTCIDIVTQQHFHGYKKFIRLFKFNIGLCICSVHSLASKIQHGFNPCLFKSDMKGFTYQIKCD